LSSSDYQGKAEDSITPFDLQVFQSLDKGQWLGKAFKQYMVEYLSLNQPLVPIGQVVGASTFDMPTGAITAYGAAAAPADWLLCDGTAVSRTTYGSLFGVIGTTYGAGDGSTTFNLPDLRGRVPVGKGTHLDVDALGDSDGQATIGSRRPHHKHTVVQPTISAPTITVDVRGHTSGPGAVGNPPTITTVDPNALHDAHTTTANGGIVASATAPVATGATVGPQTSVPVDDAPAYLVLNYIIKS
jgi:microcystin-dependent protein